MDGRTSSGPVDRVGMLLEGQTNGDAEAGLWPGAGVPSPYDFLACSVGNHPAGVAHPERKTLALRIVRMIDGCAARSEVETAWIERAHTRMRRRN